MSIFFFYCSGAHRDLHSFPTRRSSDLRRTASRWHSFRTCTPAAETRRATKPAPRNSRDRKSTRLNSSHVAISYAVFCLKKKKTHQEQVAGLLVSIGDLLFAVYGHPAAG